VTDAFQPLPASRMISMAGHVGSGKTTVARLICERTGRELFSTGRVFRELAQRLGMTVLQLNEYALTHPEVDAEVDGHLRRLAEQPRPLVIDSRMAFFFVPTSYKVYLVVDPEVGGARVYRAGRHDESYRSITAAEVEGKARERVEANRYYDLYGVVRDDWRNYDLVVDTTSAPPDLVADTVLSTNDQHPSNDRPRCFLCPNRLLPSRMPLAADAPGGREASTARIDVMVAAGHMVVVDGHRGVAAALAEGLPLIECHLAGFEDQPGRDGRSAREFAAATLSEPTLQAWESKYGLSYGPRPPWINESTST